MTSRADMLVRWVNLLLLCLTRARLCSVEQTPLARNDLFSSLALSLSSLFSHLCLVCSHLVSLVTILFTLCSCIIYSLHRLGLHCRLAAFHLWRLTAHSSYWRALCWVNGLPFSTSSVDIHSCPPHSTDVSIWFIVKILFHCANYQHPQICHLNWSFFSNLMCAFAAETANLFDNFLLLWLTLFVSVCVLTVCLSAIYSATTFSSF